MPKFCSELLCSYKVGRTLGKGTSAIVKIGTHIKTQKRVAIKILNKRTLIQKDKKSIEKIHREILILSQLNHPHIISLYDVIETKEFIYLILGLNSF